MLSIIVSVVVLFFLSMVGLIMSKCARVQISCFKGKGFAFFMPILGAIGTTCFAQILALVFPMHVIAIIYLLLCVVGIYYARAYVLPWLRGMARNKVLLLVLGAGCLLLHYPVLARGELVSLQNTNNDIAYYVSSMDWLQNHALCEQIAFSNTMPFYALANYMFTVTRFGTDILGALIMAVANLQAHQVYFVLSTTLTLATIMAAYFLMTYCLDIAEKTAIWATALLCAGGIWYFSIASQYAPQIFGIGCMMAFAGNLLLLYRYQERKYIFFTALLLVGTLTVYAEYAVYLLAIYMVVVLVDLFLYRGRGRAKRLLRAVYAGLLSFVLNPVAMYIAIKFNLFILGNALSGVSAIDPYQGNLFGFFNLIAMIFGLPRTEQVAQIASNQLGELAKVVSGGYHIGLVALALLFIGCIIFGLWKKKDRRKWIVLGWCAFFVLYESYFWISHFAYGEMKHVTTMAPWCVLIGAYFIEALCGEHTRCTWKTVAGYVCCSALILGSLCNIAANYRPGKLTYWDHTLTELRQAAQYVPPNEILGIACLDRPYARHAATYALKERPVALNAGSDFSYYSFLLQDAGAQPQRYMVVSNMEVLYYEGREDWHVLWHNEAFAIVTHTSEVMVMPVQGVSYPEVGGRDGTFQWVQDNQMTVFLCNTTPQMIQGRIALDTDAGPFTKKRIAVYDQNACIASGMAGERLQSSVISLAPGEERYLTVRYEGALNQANNGDTRSFAFMLNDLAYIPET
nr:hypothetical protein [Maliibacterium massiliense]